MISPAAANKVVFASQPGTLTAGGTSSSFAVNVEDTFGNIVTTSGTTVTLTPSVGSFSGLSTTTTSGVATFSSLSTTRRAATPSCASSTGLTSAVSSSFTVNPARAEQGIFTTAPPTTGTAGSNLTSFAVSVEDTYGNVETGSNTGNADVINLTVATGPGSIASGASATASAAWPRSPDGADTRRALHYDRHRRYTLDHDGYLDAGHGDGPAAANKVVFTSQPRTFTAGGTSSSFAVNVEDTYGNMVTTSGTTVTFTPSAGSSTALSTTDHLGRGHLQFPLSTTTPGSYTVTASSTGLTSAVSSSFTVNPAAPNKVIFTTAPPTTGTAGSNLTSFAVSVRTPTATWRPGPTPATPMSST